MPALTASPIVEVPTVEAKVPRTWLVRFCSRAEPISGPPVLVWALYPANFWMSARTVLASVTRLCTELATDDASLATVTLTGVVVTF